MNGWTFQRVTGAGRSAVAVFVCRGVTGEVRSQLQRLGFPPDRGPETRARLIAFGPEPAEDCVFVDRGNGVIELHTHGGEAVAGRVTRLLTSAGGRVNGRLSFDEECWAAVSLATTRRTAVRLAELADGRLRSTLEACERAAREEAIVMLNEWLENTPRGWADVEPRSVALIGRPNAGKSSLMNRLVGFERSLIDPRPGATRDVITAESAIDGYPVTLTDTAGLRGTEDAIEREGVARTQRTAASADVVVLVIDRSQPADDATQELLATHPDSIVVAHKADQTDQSGLVWPEQHAAVSSLTGDGVEALVQRLGSRLASERLPDEAVFFLSSRQEDVAKRLANRFQTGSSADGLWAELWTPAE